MRCPWSAAVSSSAPATTVELRCSLRRRSAALTGGALRLATAAPRARKLPVSSWREETRVASAVDIRFLDAQALRARNSPVDCRHES